jgi:tRNA A-37 threonylcarbamoyl transferase component Bud32
MTDLIGQMLGHYQIVEQIGMGGMATVYKAYQANMDRYVAVKILPKQLAEDPQFIGRFEQEARTIAKLEHKHILPVYDYGKQDDQTYLVMRYIGTGTLKDLVARGPLALADAVEYFSQIADALQYAHDHGVVHRDVKTSNVLIGERRTCYLTDFGIAKLAEGAAHFTGTGVMIGTPSYMSPEQCHGLPADSRSDIYSLGIVLYEMLTGAVPFEAETPVAVVLKQVNEPLPSPRKLNPSIPEAVEKVLFRALAKEPDDRYQAASDFSEALREAFETFTERQTMSFAVPAAAPPATETRPAVSTSPLAAVPARRPRWQLFAGIAALALAVVIVAVLALSGGGDDGNEGQEAVVSADTPTEAVGETEETTVPASEAPPSTEVAATGEETSVPAGETPPAGTEVAEVPGEPVEGTGWTLFTSTRGEGDDDRRLIITDYGVWMSSPGGLVLWKKDGSGYTKYTSADGLVFNDIQTFALDSSGRLWAGGRNNQAGLMRLDLAPDGAITNIDYFDTSNSGLRSNWIWALVPLSDGTLYAASYESLVEYWDGSTWQAPAFPTTTSDLSALGDVLWTLVRARDGALWAGSAYGLARFDGETWQIIPPPEDLAAMNDPEIGFYTIYEDPLDGAFWMGIYSNSDGNHHVRRLIPPADDSGAWTWQNAEDWVPYPLRDALRASDGSLWLVGYDRVVQVVADGTRRNEFIPGEDFPGYEVFTLPKMLMVRSG